MKASSRGPGSQNPSPWKLGLVRLVGGVTLAVLGALLVENQWFKRFLDGLSPRELIGGITVLFVLGWLMHRADNEKHEASALSKSVEWRMPAALRARLLNESARAFLPDELRLELFRVVRIQTVCQWSFYPVARDNDIEQYTGQGPTSDLPDIFQRQLNQRLLLVGNAGAGKTTALSQMGTSLVQRARESDDAPIPMRFLLSNWSSHKRDLPLAEWLGKELDGKLSKNDAWAFVNSDQLLPILEGLDEVRPERYQACVREIQTFLKQVSLRPVAISFRAANDNSLPKFDLPVARVLDLTAKQVDSSLARPEMTSTRQLLDQSPELRKEIRTPLWLEVAYLASKSLVAERDPNEAATDYLYGRFISYALSHNLVRYQKEQGPKKITRSELLQLGWLAEVLTRTSHSDFGLADLAPYWLSSDDAESPSKVFSGKGAIRILCLAILWSPILPLIGYLRGHIGNPIIGLALSLIAIPLFAPGDVTPFRRSPISVIGMLQRGNGWALWSVGSALITGLVLLYRQGSMPTTWLSVSLELSILIAAAVTGALLKTGSGEGTESHTELRGFKHIITQSLRFTCISYILVLCVTAVALFALGISFIYLSIWESPARLTLRWAMEPLFDFYLLVPSHPFIIPLSLALSTGTWVVFLKNGGLFTMEHWWARLSLWSTGKLPFDLGSFLHRCSEQLLLVRRNDRVEFFHPTFREYMQRKYGPGRDLQITYSQHRTPDILEEFRRKRDQATLQAESSDSIDTGP